MYSLGVILFEMCYPVFTTGMERVVAITNFREKGIFPVNTNVVNPMLDNFHQIIHSLLRQNPQERPSALELSNSSLLPPRLQADSSYFKEFTSALVDGRHSRNGIFHEVVQTIFDSSRSGGSSSKEQSVHNYYMNSNDIIVKAVMPSNIGTYKIQVDSASPMVAMSADRSFKSKKEAPKTITFDNQIMTSTSLSLSNSLTRCLVIYVRLIVR